MEIPISVFLEAVTQETSSFLKQALPQIGDDKYWEKYVLPPLSPQQKRQLDREHKHDIDDLDFAALIKILIKHWSEISYKLKIKDPSDSRTILHGMKDIRNKYSHTGSKRPPNDTLYRHLDNIYQYLVMIDAGEDVVGKVASEKNRVLVSMQPEKDFPQGEVEEKIESGEQQEPEAQDSTLDELAPKSTTTEGVPIGILTLDAEDGEEAKKLLGQKTFIGIDFGTSTTIVSQVTESEDGNRLTSRPIPIKQFDDMGRTIEDILVPTCIAWTGSQLLVGQGAVALKTDYEYGKNIWFSFKMKLGIDLGKPYYRSLLSGDDVPVTIQNPQQAAVVFFNYLREQIENYVKENSLPQEIVYAVSVPASFEANQRMDLVNALHDAGLKIPEYGIIDEPNAAFISYLVETLEYGKGIIEGLPGKQKRILVFDFGAGTCDISILEIEGSQSSIQSKNLAISQFHALGGDNIDRRIVRKLLLDKFYSDNDVNEDIFTSTELSEIIIPKLQKAAEDLKIQCSKYIMNNWNDSDISPFQSLDRNITGSDVPKFQLRDMQLGLKKPSMSFKEFAELLEPFISAENIGENLILREEDVVNIFEPIYSALDKAEIDRDDLDSILFIGGSCLNPHVLAAVQSHFGRFVEPLILKDLRSPVSQGSAIHSFMVNGFGRDFLKPIISESIYVITSNAGLRNMLPAGTEIPSPEIAYEGLKVQREGQEIVELPFCVTNEDKLLAVVEIRAPDDQGFKQADKISLRCAIDANKLLQVTASVGTVQVTSTVLNPLANRELTPEESDMLAARQRLYINAASNSGLPYVHDMISYAYACVSADNHIASAEAFEAAERLDNERDFAVHIGFHYAMGGKHMLSDKWTRIDYERHPTAVSAFNLALTARRHSDGDEFIKLMEESLRLNENFFPALEIFGHYLHDKGDPKGITMIDRAFKIMSISLKAGTLDEDDFPRLSRAAKTVGRRDVISEMEAVKSNRGQGVSYKNENLAEADIQAQPFQGGF